MCWLSFNLFVNLNRRHDRRKYAHERFVEWNASYIRLNKDGFSISEKFIQFEKSFDLNFYLECCNSSGVHNWVWQQNFFHRVYVHHMFSKISIVNNCNSIGSSFVGLVSFFIARLYSLTLNSNLTWAQFCTCQIVKIIFTNRLKGKIECRFNTKQVF